MFFLWRCLCDQLWSLRLQTFRPPTHCNAPSIQFDRVRSYLMIWTNLDHKIEDLKIENILNIFEMCAELESRRLLCQAKDNSLGSQRWRVLLRNTETYCNWSDSKAGNPWKMRWPFCLSSAKIRNVVARLSIVSATTEGSANCWRTARKKDTNWFYWIASHGFRTNSKDLELWIAVFHHESHRQDIPPGLQMQLFMQLKFA